MCFQDFRAQYKSYVPLSTLLNYSLIISQVKIQGMKNLILPLKLLITLGLTAPSSLIEKDLKEG